MTEESIDVKITPLKLSYRNESGSGKQIFLTADIKGDPKRWKTGEQCSDILQNTSGDVKGGMMPAYFSECFNCHGAKDGITTMLGTAPWVQFPAPAFDSMMDKLFSQMVDAWNEKHAQPLISSS